MLICRISRLLALAKKLQEQVSRDWFDVPALVTATESDLVQVAFHVESVDSQEGLRAYMNRMAKGAIAGASLPLRKGRCRFYCSLKRDISSTYFVYLWDLEEL